VDTKYVM